MQISKSSALLFFLTFLWLISWNKCTTAQTVHFNMDVQTELGVEVLEDLNFGTVISNSGTNQIALGNSQMGIFKIRALAAQSAILSLQKPKRLTPSAGQDTASTVPVNLDAAYSPQAGNYQDVLPFANNMLQITLSGENDEQVWDTGYVYIFGNIDVGDISAGSYSGTLVLNIAYQ